MKVLLLIESAAAGAGRHVLHLVGGLTRNGISTHLVYGSERTDRMFRAGLERIQSQLDGVAGLQMHHSPHPMDIIAIAQLRRYVRAHGPFDVIHCHSTKAGFVGRIGLSGSSAAIIYTPHAPLTMSPTISRATHFAVQTLEVSLSSRAGAIIAVSEYEAAHLIGLGISQSKIFVVPNGVQALTDRARLRAQVRANLGIADCDIVVGFVGRLEKQKRLDLLFRAFSALPQDLNRTARLVIIGSGSLQTELEALALDLGITARIHWAGEVPRADVMMPAFDVFALPSDYEAMPYSLLEAIAAGLPVVATRVGGTTSAVLDGRNGFVVDPGGAAEMSGCLTALLRDDELRGRMSSESLVLTRHFSIDRMVDRTLDIYSRLLTAVASVVPVAA